MEQARTPGSDDQQVDVPPALDDDEDVFDAEIVENPIIESDGSGSIASDYSDSGVPRLEYLRNRIESRFTTAVGSTEIATDAAIGQAALQAAARQQAVIDEGQQREFREAAAAEKLAEIRRSLRPQG